MTMTDFPAIERLAKDLRDATATMSEKEARFLVDAYYIIQEDRKRSKNQVTAMGGEPHSVLAWFFNQNQTLEAQIKAGLDRYSLSKPIGRWARDVFGIGPVITAGLIAHIDIGMCPTVGHIWRFAGLDPSIRWEKGQKRPWNASLKTLCWHIGQSFMKLHNDDRCFYGKIYEKRKAFENERNDRGDNAELAKQLALKFKKTTDAYVHLMAGRLPPAQIDARARRYATKLFLAHLHQRWYELEFGKPAPLPYPIAHLGHVHVIDPPH
jgi:hypothetical protein